MPSVWKGLSDKSQHLACWYARENWLRMAAWRVAVSKHITWRQRMRALNWKEQTQLLHELLEERRNQKTVTTKEDHGRLKGLLKSIAFRPKKKESKN